MKQALGNATILALAILSASLGVNSGVAADTIEISTGEDPPWTGQELKQGGLVTEIVVTALERAGHDVKMTWQPWKRGERAVLEGNALGTFPYYKTKARMKKYKYFDTVVAIRNVLTVAEENAGKWTKPADLDGLTSCYPVGWSFSSEMLREKEKNGAIERMKPQSFKQCFELLDRGRVDFFPADKFTGTYYANAALGSADNVVFQEDFHLTTANLFFIVDKDDPNAGKQIKKFNAALQGMKDDGTYDEIVAKHRGYYGQ